MKCEGRYLLFAILRFFMAVKLNAKAVIRYLLFAIGDFSWLLNERGNRQKWPIKAKVLARKNVMKR